MEKLVIAGREFNSRLFLGTGKFNNNNLRMISRGSVSLRWTFPCAYLTPAGLTVMPIGVGRML